MKTDTLLYLVVGLLALQCWSSLGVPTLLYCLLGVCCFALALAVWQPPRRRGCGSTTATASLPGPTRWQILGNMWRARDDGSGKILELTAGLIAEHGPVVRACLADTVHVVLSDADDVQAVLCDPRVRDRTPAATMSTFFFGDGLINRRGDRWKRRRRLMTPHFHFRVLHDYVEVFARKGGEMVERLEEVADGRSFDVSQYLNYCTLDSILETAIGSTGFPKEFLENTRDSITKLMHASFQRLQLTFVLPKCMHWMIFSTPTAYKLAKFFRKSGADVISEKIKSYRSGVRGPDHVTSSGNHIKSILDLTIEGLDGGEGEDHDADASMSVEEALDEVLTLLGAGMDTTATTMSFCLLLLGIHQDVQEQVRAETMAIFDGAADARRRPATSADVSRMHVLERVLKETLRLYPPGAFMSRDIPFDLTLPSGHTLPVGCGVVVAVYVLHRSPKYYTEPHKFLPDRWLPENSTNRHPFAYLPFGAGARNCIGQKYAMLQMKTVLAALLRRYHVTTDYKMEDIGIDRLNAPLTVALSWPQRYQIRLQRLHDEGR